MIDSSTLCHVFRDLSYFTCGSRRFVELNDYNGGDNQKWIMSQEGSIKTVKCPNDFFTVDGGQALGPDEVEAGTQVVTNDDVGGWFQEWTAVTSFEREDDNLFGPLSIVNPSNMLAIGVKDDDCTLGNLELQLYDIMSDGQKFYFGAEGVLFSVRCPGKAIGKCRTLNVTFLCCD